MGIKVTHTCDRCGAEVDTSKPTQGPFWEVGVLARVCAGYGWLRAPHNQIHTLKQDYKMFLCRTCMHNLGMEFQASDLEAPSDPPSLEDIIQDIVDNAVTAALEEDR